VLPAHNVGHAVPDVKRCSATTRAGRLAKARQFLRSADTIATILDEQEIADADVTMCVHGGVAAADVICCARLGQHHDGKNHTDAVALLAKVDKVSAKPLKTPLDMKTRAGYSAVLTSTADRKRAGRAAAALLGTAETV
jgi:hypothetical protein